jgi:hypothetical protein
MTSPHDSPTMISIPGSGELTQRQRELLARSLTLAPIEPNTVMVKALPPAILGRYLRAEISAGRWGEIPPFDYRRVGGTVARQQDTTHLRTPPDFIRGFRLDYQGSPFRPDQRELHTMEFLAIEPRSFVIPLGAPTLQYPRTGYPPNQADVRIAAHAMIDAARTAGLDPNTYRMELNPWPCSGTGITADPEFGFPERWMCFNPIPNAATIFAYDQVGNKTPVAIYRGVMLGWESFQ